MNSIRTLMADDHCHCDHLMSEVEAAVADNDLARASVAFEAFAAVTQAHFRAEEETLFPAFERQTGITQGPTMVMRHEHEQMRVLLEDIRGALQGGAAEDYYGVSETLLIMMQQHNMKEENVLYPMCDSHLQAGLPSLLNALGEALQAS